MIIRPVAPSRPHPRRVAALILPALVVAASCAGTHRATVPAVERPLAPSPDERHPVRHVVEEGQTLWRIARTYGVALEDLARANDIADPSVLAIGQSLIVPGATRALPVPPYPAPALGDPSSGAAVSISSLLDWPVPGGHVLSPYGAARRSHRHEGIDIGAARGNPVRAADAGLVVYSGSTLRGYGKTIIIDHGGGLRSLYAHNSQLLAGEGRRVERGQIIARVGRTGNASSEHCHFEIRRNDVPVDPMPYLARPTENVR